MAEFYKLEIANWNEGTANLTLEQEAAYLRVINAIRLSEQPITFNYFVLCGLWRCNERKAKRILQELIDAGKVRIEGGKIINDKAVDDASNLRGLRVDRASAGRRGGIESGKVRAKALKDNDTSEAIASTREEKRREEKKEKEDTSVSSQKTRRRPEVPLPDNWVPSDRNFADAESKHLTPERINDEADRFRDYHLARGSRFRDWDAAWRTWVSNAGQFARGRGGNGRESPGDRTLRIIADAARGDTLPGLGWG